MLYERPKEWELIPEYRLNICVCVCVCPSPCKKRWGFYFLSCKSVESLVILGKFDYFILPHECSHILCAHNLFSPAWYIISYILGCQACTKSQIMYVANIHSSYVGVLIVLRSYVCKILDLYRVLTYLCRIYWFLMTTMFCQYWIPTYRG